MGNKKTSAKNVVMSSTGSAPARARSERPRSVKPAETPSLVEGAAALPARPVPAQAPSREEVANLAYLYWEARGCQGGSPEEDWIRAEQELQTRVSATLA